MTGLKPGGGTRTFRGLLIPSQGCSWKRLKWLGENIKPWIENRATSRHSTVNLGLVLLHKLFCIYMTKIRAFWVPDFAKFGNSFYSKFWHINQKKFMKQKRQLIDHWVASRGPFLRFLFHFRDKSFFMTTGATLVRYEQPSEGSASPPCVSKLVCLLP